MILLKKLLLSSPLQKEFHLTLCYLSRAHSEEMVFINMATNQKSSHKANEELCNMIEGLLYELIPDLEKPKAKQLARQFSSLQALRTKSSMGRANLKATLRKLSRKMLAIAERRRNATNATSCRSEEIVTDAKPPSSERQDKGGCHEALSERVGEAQYHDIVSVSQEIMDIRARSAVWTKFSQQKYCGEEELRPASETLPTEISDLYFRTRLVDVMRAVDSTAAPNPDEIIPSIVQRSDWDVLLEDAQTKLAAYRKFEAENVDENDKLSFFCSQGSCR